MVLLRGRFGGLPRRHPATGGGEELRVDNWLFGGVLWELLDKFCCVADPDPIGVGATSRLRPFRLPTRGVG